MFLDPNLTVDGHVSSFGDLSLSFVKNKAISYFLHFYSSLVYFGILLLVCESGIIAASSLP